LAVLLKQKETKIGVKQNKGGKKFPHNRSDKYAEGRILQAAEYEE